MDNRWKQAVSKLTELTRIGEIQWKASHEFCRHREKELNCVGPAYLTTIKEKRIAIFEFRYKDTSGVGESSWDTGIAIEFIDQNFEPEWVWPGVDEHYALMEAVRQQTSHAEEFLDSFLTNSA